jgi:ribonuclease R
MGKKRKGTKKRPQFAHWREQDPAQARERANYGKPVPSREFILEYLSSCDGPQGFDEIDHDLGLNDDEERGALGNRLNAMVRDGQLLRNRKSGYGLVDKMDLVAGVVLGHPDGHGRLLPDQGGDAMVLRSREMRMVLHGDRVLARATDVDRRGRTEAAIVEVVERANHEVVGRYHVEQGIALVAPDNKRISQDILVPAGKDGGAKSGQIVVVEILDQPTRRSPPSGRVVEVVGDHMGPGMEIDIAIRSHSIPQRWPDAVNDECANLSTGVTAEQAAGRVDLREIALVTIDGEDARDFDDAVYCETTPKGWKLWVAIADVSTYVAPGTALNAEAHKRGNSTYFPEQVIPMLPEELSNGLCSLNPDVDRLCMVCETHFDHDGAQLRSRFYEAVMRSHARLTYTEANAIVVEQDEEARARRAALVPALERLHQLYGVLRKRREKRGAIDFDSQETRFIFGEGRKVEQIVPVVRNDAHRMIEECMISANVAAAGFLRRREVGGLYRVHAKPEQEKVDDLRNFLAEFGVKLRGGDEPKAKHYAEVVNKANELDNAFLIQTVLLRSLKQAVYSADNVGHFGLALEEYAHFTSPIRRYPDLVVHRAIKHALTKQPPAEFVHSKLDLQRLGEHCSMTERRSDEAVRDAVDWLKCDFMSDKVGEEFDGMITAVTSFGLFVQLKGLSVDGLIHITALDNDYYHFDPMRRHLVGERSGRVYRLADKMRVKLVRVDMDERNIDLEPVESQPKKKRRRA